MLAAWGWAATGVSGYPENQPCGEWYSFPAGAECRAPHPHAGCTWTRHPVAKVVRGSSLIAAGWNTSNSTSVANYHEWSPSRSQVDHNAGLMEAAAAALAGGGNRCCGC